MSTPFYRAPFRPQLTGSALAGVNCGAAAGAMLVAQATLGKLGAPTPDAFRRLTGDTVGGLIIATIGNTLERYGVGVTIYDASDGLTFGDLVAQLRVGRFAVVNGDYDVIPQALRGSDTFADLHSEFWHAVTPEGIVVGDPLNDGRVLASGRRAQKGYVTYPMSVARAYVEKYDRQVAGVGIHAAVMDRRRLEARPVAPATNVRSAPTRLAGIIGRFGGPQTITWGGTVQGESIRGNAVWYRVWLPSASSIGFCHSSVVAKV